MNENYNDLYREIMPFLRHDETVLWTGTPGKIPASQTNPLLPIFAIFWMGFALFWTITATAIGGAFGLFGVFFMIIGGISFYTAFFGKRNFLKNAVYVVTEVFVRNDGVSAIYNGCIVTSLIEHGERNSEYA